MKVSKILLEYNEIIIIMLLFLFIFTAFSYIDTEREYEKVEYTINIENGEKLSDITNIRYQQKYYFYNNYIVTDRELRFDNRRLEYKIDQDEWKGIPLNNIKNYNKNIKKLENYNPNNILTFILESSIVLLLIIIFSKFMHSRIEKLEDKGDKTKKLMRYI